MNRLLFNGKYIIFSVMITTLALIAINKIASVNFGVIALVLYYLFFGFYLGQFFLPHETRFWKIFWGAIGIACLQIILLSPVYWFYQFNIGMLITVLIIIPLLISLQRTQETDLFARIEKILDPNSFHQAKSYLGTKFLSLLFLAGDALLLFTLYLRQYTDTLISPWTIIGPRFFILFIITTFILFWTLQKSKDSSWNLFLLIIHSFLTLNVAFIIFQLGFGFDPFIHQATEKWIAEHGVIFPKQPYYIGQYMLVLAVYFITHLPIHPLDKALAPITASLLLPLSAFFAFSRTGLQEKIFPALLMLFFIPLSFFTVTTPNNFALLLSLVLSFWIWHETKNGTIQTHIFGILLALAIIAIHPFIGLPVLIIYLCSITIKQFNHLTIKPLFKNFVLILYFLFLTAVLPLAFYLNYLRLGEKLALQNPLSHINNFVSIFTRPHWLFLERGDMWLQILYLYRGAIKPLILCMIIIGISIAIKKYKEKITYFYLISASALAVSAFILATTIKFPKVISYEQTVYSQRLLELTLILLLPFFIITLRELFILLRRQPMKQFLISGLFAFLLLISWYFTYPTRNQISLYTGYNIRQADIGAVHFIDNRNNGVKDYIVLTNQTVATAALREFGFAKYLPTPAGEQYFYSIPTGGPLYQYFRKMVYEEPKRKWMEEAMRFAGVKKAYFVHTNYWAPAAVIRDAAKLEADNWWELSGGRVWVYEYTAKD